MSCGRTVKLEALVAGELPVGQARELQAHAATCSRCRHELNWLESEQALFRQRASREEVAHLWSGVVTRSGGKAAPRAWSRVLVAVAASLLVLLAGGRLLAGASHHATPRHVETVPAEALQSVLAQSFDVDERCSLGGPGSPGFHCAAPLPASLLASR